MASDIKLVFYSSTMKTTVTMRLYLEVHNTVRSHGDQNLSKLRVCTNSQVYSSMTSKKSRPTSAKVLEFIR